MVCMHGTQTLARFWKEAPTTRGMTQAGPPLAKLRFLPGFEDPFNVWQKCVKIQEKWEKTLSSEAKYAEGMKEFKDNMEVELIWSSNFLEDTLPKGISRNDVENAWRNKVSSPIQVKQHFKAFKLLCKPEGRDDLPDLTEDVIKKAHGIMMHGLKNEQGLSINAGSYRTISVRSGGGHVYPSYTCIPHNMAKLVKEYNEKFSNPHDPYELASWLHFNICSLHPFEDGNGRISRLLWCYSLMRDKLPFPTVLTSGHRKSQKHLVLCLERDRDRIFSYSNNPHMTTLTVVSVLQAWEQFFSVYCKISLSLILEQ